MKSITKICPRCKQEYDLTPEFWHKDKYTKSGFCGYCKQCNKSKVKTWQQDNPEKHKERACQWNKNNSRKHGEHVRRWQHKNPDKVKKSNQKWHKNNPEKVKEYQRQWTQKNHDRYIAAKHKRKALKLGNGGSYTQEELYQQFLDQDGRCFHCGKFISPKNGKICHIDHWIPISKGGSNNIDNIRLLCPHCNLTKHDKMPWEWSDKYINENPDVINSP